MSTVVAGPFLAIAALLLVAGLAKVARPGPTARAMGNAGLPATPLGARLIGVAEVLIAAAAIVLGARPLALLVFAAYLLFAAFTIRLIARTGGTADCGCFGADEAPATQQHVALDLGAAAIAAFAALAPPGTIGSVLADQPLHGVPFVALVGMCTWLGFVSFTLLPALSALRTENQHDSGNEG